MKLTFPRCDVELYDPDAKPGEAPMLLPRALRINGEVVYTPRGTRYRITAGQSEALSITLTFCPTSLKILPGPPPDEALRPGLHINPEES